MDDVPSPPHRRLDGLKRVTLEVRRDITPIARSMIDRTPSVSQGQYADLDVDSGRVVNFTIATDEATAIANGHKGFSRSPTPY
jgi:hypothetical protein